MSFICQLHLRTLVASLRHPHCSFRVAGALPPPAPEVFVPSPLLLLLRLLWKVPYSTSFMQLGKLCKLHMCMHIYMCVCAYIYIYICVCMYENVCIRNLGHQVPLKHGHGKQSGIRLPTVALANSCKLGPATFWFSWSKASCKPPKILSWQPSLIGYPDFGKFCCEFCSVISHCCRTCAC